MFQALQAPSSCDAGSSVCPGTSVASDAGGLVLAGLNAGPIVSALVAAAVLLVSLLFVVWVVRRVAPFFDLLASVVAEWDDTAERRRQALECYRDRSLSEPERGRSLVDDDDREDDSEDDEEDDGVGANKRGVQGGLT